MSSMATASLASLYQDDETAWLELMSQLIAERRFDEVDFANLQEYLADMAGRDKREVLRRLTTLIAHRLKWEHQPDKRSKSWRQTIAGQRRELEDLLTSGTLRNHAEEVLVKAYGNAVEEAAIETELPESAFPAENSRTLEQWMAKDV